MKNKITLIALLFSLTLFSQYNSSAPWMKNLEEVSEREYTIDEMKISFDNYWLNKNKSKKGSGYKPFMRWEYHWSNKTNSQGYLITPSEMWNAFYQKNQASLNRSANSPAVVGEWVPLGPFSHLNTGSWSSGQGRVNIVHVDPSNSNTIYMGTPAGGIWKSTDSGDSWVALSDNLPQIGVSGIAVDYSNSNTIYIATGDKDGSDTYSVGVLKSTDGGLTWNTTGLSFTNTTSYAGDLLIHPTDNQILWCATSNGIYKTTNAGTSWTQVQSGNFARGTLRLKPNDPTTVYAASKNRFFRSTDAGNSFSIITTGLPTAASRMILDVTPANADYIYILATTDSGDFQGIYKSINGGTNWIKTSGTTDIFDGSGQSYYDLALAVSDTNENEIYTGCLNIWKSTNGGANMTNVNNWSSPNAASYTHADIHYLGFHSGKLYCGSDGGIYVSNNGGIQFTDKTSGAQISQFYKISVSKQSSNHMVGGLQDNGGHAFSNSIWKNYYGADGMDTAISKTDPNKYYGFIQNGLGLYISNNAGNTLGYSVDAPSGETGNWVTPLIGNGIGEIFAGYSKLYQLNGNTWTQQSISDTGSGNIDLIAIDPLNDDLIYVVNQSVLYKSTDKGITFVPSYTSSESIVAIEIHASNSNIIYIATSGTSGQVLKSVDGGNIFANIASGLPNIGKNTIAHQGMHPDNPLYVGTSLGVYYIDDTMTSWQPFNTNLPNVAVTDLEINLEDGKLIAATYGRGIWQTDIPVQIPNDDIKLVQIINPSTNINCSVSSIIPQIQVKNNGINTISAVTINYTVDGNINAYTWNGTINSNQETLIDLPAITSTRGTHTLEVNASISNDAYIYNNNRTITFFVNDEGTIGVINNFSTVSDELISYNEGVLNQSQWVIGTRSGDALDTGGNSVYTTNLSGDYPNNIKAYLVSQCYNLTSISNPQINFDLAYDLELNWDLLYVEYSTNFGQTWNVLGEMGANWYNSDRTPQTSNDCDNCVGAQWTGSNTTSSSYFYPLNALNSEPNIIFRFVFHSDYTVTNLGVTVDNFVISGVLSNQNFELNNIAIYPNPSKNNFNISLGDIQPKSIDIYDLTGKIVYSNNNLIISNHETILNLSEVSSGIYFVKINTDNQSIVKRIIKQ